MACQRTDYGHSLGYQDKRTRSASDPMTAFWSIAMDNIQSAAARSHNNSTSHIKPRRAGVPCVRCRQMKVYSERSPVLVNRSNAVGRKANSCLQVKCNARQKFPASCSACQKAGERCAVDPLFKRISKRR